MSAAAAAQRSYRILLVEDSPDDAELLEFALRNAPFRFSIQRVELESHFEEALRDPPDVVLCDYHLPRFSMPRALNIVREERGLDTPFIVVSRLIGEEAAVEAMQRGANDYLLKGRLGRLASAIQAAIERNQARRDKAQVEQALRRSDLLNRSLLNSLSMRIAVLDAGGYIVAANRAWEQFHRNEVRDLRAPVAGQNYLEQLRSVGGADDMEHVRAGIEAVMQRREPRYALEYEVAGHGGSRWEMLRAEPLEDSEHGAVVSVEDVTPRMLAQLALHDAHRHLQQLSRRLLSVQEEERRAIALELHDDMGQTLTAQKIALHNLSQQLAGTEHAARVQHCLGIAGDILENMRRLAYSLRPPQLDEFGIEGALSALAQSQQEASNLRVESRANGLTGRLPNVIEAACYRIAQEALNNATRHARAKRVDIEVEQNDRLLRLTIRDDGCGFDPEEARHRAARSGSLGLLGMAERADLAGGRLKVRSLPGSGTVVTATFVLGDERARPDA